jgi:sigma-E factor negative regulatory protein RseA
VKTASQGYKDSDHMTEKHYESLSALMDNEAEELELRRILKEMEAESGLDGQEMSALSADLKGKWHRYHVVSASLKREIHAIPSSNLLASIQAELADEPVPMRDSGDVLRQETRTSSASTGKGIMQLLGQGAIAASMALAVLFTADLVMVADNSGTGPASMELADSTTSSGPLRGLTGELNPSTRTQVAVQNAIDAEELRRLERVVSAELEDVLEAPALPATFVPPASR